MKDRTATGWTATLIVLGALGLSSCGKEGAAAKSDSKVTDETKAAVAEIWVCPMGHEQSNKAGKCSKCGMAYVKK